MTKVDLGGVQLGLQRLQRLLRSRRPWAALAATAAIDLPEQEMQVLLVLADGRPRSIADVARLAGMDAAAVSRQVRGLEDRGLVTRRPSPGHGRVVLIEPTEEGRRCTRQVQGLRARHLADTLASWSPEDRETLGRLLVRLVDDLERTPYRPSGA